MILTGFGDTQDEIRAKLQAEVDRIQGVIDAQSWDLAQTKMNPLNYVLETQRDAMTRAENTITQNKSILSQLKSTMNAAVSAGGDKLTAWTRLAAIIGGTNDLQIWAENLSYTSTANAATTVAKDTAQDVVHDVQQVASVGKGVLYAAGAVAASGFLLYMFTRGRSRSES